MPKKFIKYSILQGYHHLPALIKLEIEIFAITLMIISGSIIFHFIEGWSYLDSAYFATMTLATVGFGDFVPHTNIGKIFTMGYALLGIPLFLYAASLLTERRIDALKLFSK